MPVQYFFFVIVMGEGQLGPYRSEGTQRWSVPIEIGIAEEICDVLSLLVFVHRVYGLSQSASV